MLKVQCFCNEIHRQEGITSRSNSSIKILIYSNHKSHQSKQLIFIQMIATFNSGFYEFDLYLCSFSINGTVVNYMQIFESSRARVAKVLLFAWTVCEVPSLHLHSTYVVATSPDRQVMLDIPGCGQVVLSVLP